MFPFVLSHDEDDNNGGKKIAGRPGCLDAITLDLMWITAYIVGLCFMAIFADVLVILSVGWLLRVTRHGGGSFRDFLASAKCRDAEETWGVVEYLMFEMSCLIIDSREYGDFEWTLREPIWRLEEKTTIRQKEDEQRSADEKNVISAILANNDNLSE
ncbi:hypothetical protein WN55_10485 [Dufourea novaeangliae]|uniref:Uncharacterized protein n=1 Tax=Dufourea novaeangliae TaxID=178035 RepID=A0A154P5G2_DUFNO|nr:hypothetical protein WN55_10485 [Dufourea novaeangliae]